MDLLQDVASALERGGAEAHGRCIRYDVRAAAPNDVARALDARASESPDLWVPDSSAWLERIGSFEGERGWSLLPWPGPPWSWRAATSHSRAPGGRCCPAAT